MALYKYTHQYKYWWAPASELQGPCHVFIDVAKDQGWLHVKSESGFPPTGFGVNSGRIVFCINRGGVISTPSPIFKIHKIKTENKCRIPERLLDRVERIMSNSTTLSGPVEIKDKSVERVAFDLMEKIAYLESRKDSNVFADPNPREYYLKLYNQCHRVVSWNGVDVKAVLEESNS